MPEYESLNEAQRRAVTWEGGPLLVLAGPGSGKTLTIVKRISYLLEKGTAPEQILVITFTREAAESMQRRFRTSAERFCSVSFGTFHSVFYHILKESHYIQKQKLLNNSEKIDLMIPVLKKRRFVEHPYEDAVVLLSAISFYKNTCRMEETLSKVPADWQKDFAEIYREYDSAVRKNGSVDFDDMLFLCRRLLNENPSIRQSWQKRFPYILIDEFQDINPVQYEIIRLLASAPYHIFAVGDDDQSIYGFRGSSPQCLKRFQEEFQAHKILLDINYRSGQKIVEASLKTMEESSERFDKQIRSSHGDAEAGSVRLKSFLEKGAEQQYLLNRLLELQEEAAHSPETAGTAAVLFRTNAAMQSFAAGLRRKNIAFHMKEQSKSIYEHFISRDIMAYLLLAEGKGSRESLLRIMNRPERSVSRELTLQEESASPGMRMLRRQLACMKDFEPKLAVTYLLKAVGYEQYLRKLSQGRQEQWQEWQELLDWLKSDAAGYRTASQWQEAQQLFGERLEQERRNGSGRGRDVAGGNAGEAEYAVQLLTVHGSKGLEFDAVFIPDCNEGVFPHGFMPDAETVEEERRILYVAMTRAKKSLELLYLTGTDKSPRLPSRFLNPLLYSSSSTTSSNSQPSRYSSNASVTFSYTSSSSI